MPRVARGIHRPDLRKKKVPSQQRSTDTLNLILDVTAKLLGEVGIERLSTNMICKRAGLTPPPLYRYFPNKYAVLKELGVRLMDCQNAAYLEWQKTHRPTRQDDSPQRSLQAYGRSRRSQTMSREIFRVPHGS